MGNFELGVAEYERLLIKLEEHFIKKISERPVHPCNLLTTANSPYHIKSKSPLFAITQLLKEAVKGNVINGSPRVGIYLTAWAAVLIKR